MLQEKQNLHTEAEGSLVSNKSIQIPISTSKHKKSIEQIVKKQNFQSFG